MPAQSLCFVAGAALAGSSAPENAVRVRDARFYKTNELSAAEKRLIFSKKAAAALFTEASSLMAEAKAVHDDIESVYVPCVDFDAVREREARLCEEIGL